MHQSLYLIDPAYFGHITEVVDKMDMKIIITFVALYFTETARAQHGDLSALLGLASGKKKVVLNYDWKGAITIAPIFGQQW